MLALALLDHAFILHVLVAGLAVEPCPGIWYHIARPFRSPLDLLGRLGDEESDGVGRHLAAPGVDGDLGVAALVRLHFYRQQEQLQFHKTQPGVESQLDGGMPSTRLNDERPLSRAGDCPPYSCQSATSVWAVTQRTPTPEPTPLYRRQNSSSFW